MPLFRTKPESVEPAAAPAPEPEEPTPAGTPPPVPADLPDPLVADITTNLWRAGKKLGQPAADAESDRTIRAAARHVRAAMDSFAQAEVYVQDHDGTLFDPGLALEVVAYEPRPDAARETVLETVRPCVYRSGRRIQIGQVIVAQPEKSSRKGRK
jgi:hypothetical protein